jgi:hypothetical protein
MVSRNSFSSKLLCEKLNFKVEKINKNVVSGIQIKPSNLVSNPSKITEVDNLGEL